MKQKADLTLAQIQQAWNFAETINEEYDNFERKDFLGAYIHKDQYNQDTEFGWCVEYILDQEFLNQYSTTDADIFCEANVRVLFFKNFKENLINKRGEYSVFYKYENIYQSNRLQSQRQISYITQENIDILKKTYGLPDEVINEYIKTNFFYEPSIQHNI